MIEIALMMAAAGAEAGGADTAWWQDTSLWVSVAFVAVVGILLYFGAHRQAADALDKRAQKIADELDEARRLREEAQELLAQYQRRQRMAEEEAEGIIEQARRDAKRFAAAARQKIEEQIERRTKSAEDKIARAEAQAIAEVRGETADLAVEAARSIIRSRMDQGAHSAMAEKSISDLRSRLQ